MASKDPHAMSAEDRQTRFDHLWEKLDKDKSGELEYDEFKVFLKKYNRKDMEEKQYEFFFRGSDIDGDKTISKEEMLKLATALATDDQLYINKLFFRAVDEDGSGKIEAGEFVVMADLNGIKGMTVEKAEKQISKLSGGNDFLTFPQMHKALTGQDLPEDTDPYDGKRRKNQQEKKEEKPKKEEEKKEEKPEELKPEKKENLKLQTNETPKWVLITMIALSGLAIIAMILCAASTLYAYNQYKSQVDEYKKLENDPENNEQLKAKVNTGFSPSKIKKLTEETMVEGFFSYFIIAHYDSDEKTLEKFYQNLIYYGYAQLLVPGILCVLFAVIEILILVWLILELLGKKLPFIKAAFYGPVVRGFIYIFISIPVLGASSDLGASSGIITCIVGIAILVVGILEAALPKTAKVGN